MNEPEAQSQIPPAKPKKSGVIIGTWIGAGVFAVVAAIAVPLLVAENAKSNQIRNALEECGIGILEAHVLDDGNAVSIPGATLDGQATAEDVICLLDELEAPRTVPTKMSTTRALDGTQSDSWGDFAAQWTYHPDNGLSLLIERRD